DLSHVRRSRGRSGPPATISRASIDRDRGRLLGGAVPRDVVTVAADRPRRRGRSPEGGCTGWQRSDVRRRYIGRGRALHLSADQSESSGSNSSTPAVRNVTSNATKILIHEYTSAIGAAVKSSLVPTTPHKSAGEITGNKATASTKSRAVVRTPMAANKFP